MSYLIKTPNSLLYLCLVQGNIESKMNRLSSIIDKALTSMPKVCAQIPTVLCLVTGKFRQKFETNRACSTNQILRATSGINRKM